MKWIRIFVTLIIISFAVCTQAETSLDRLNETLELIDNATKDAYDEAVNESLTYAPSGFSIYQLRGNAQKEAQRLLNKLTDNRGLPRYELNTIRFIGTLRDSAAGTATRCKNDFGELEMSLTISLNEILFLRNYENFIHIIVPHEVAHVITCLSGGYERKEGETLQQASHNKEWFQAMREIGFPEPGKYITHNLDLTPVYLYKRNLAKKIDKVLNRNEKE